MTRPLVLCPQVQDDSLEALFNKFAIDHDDHWEVCDAALDHKILYGNSSVIGSMEEIRPLFAVDQVEIQMDIERNPLKEINIHSSDHDLIHKISSPSHEGDQGLSHRIQPPSNGVYQHLLRIYDPNDVNNKIEALKTI
ncbi:hypothetical protein MJO29_007026 [Puccinia striiformis f. sp. tritici]|nr:hypothetical protein MJO29_007026 [Puccinia striiformis f. sp. tritici]